MNSLDSTFCKKCGTPLSDEDLKEAGEKLEALVAEGITLYNAGRFDEAMEVAEAAVASNPSSVSALSLKGDCHAHRGEVAEAIEAYERVVELNPDSALDKLRLNQLRNQIVLQAQPVQPDRRVALVGALATVVLVVCIAAILARSNSQARQRQDLLASNQTATVDPNTPQQEFYQPPAQQQTQPQASTSQGTATPNQPQQGNGQGTARSDDQTDNTPLPSLPDRSLGLPKPSRDGSGSVETTIVPVTPTGPVNGGAQADSSSNHATRTNGGDEDPATSPTPGTTPPKPQAEDNGYINIEVRGGGKPLAGGSQSTDGVGAQALVRVARQQFMLGNYSSAATAYEKALASGADSIGVNQRLGQVYERLGRTGDAAAAYNRAISAAGSAIASGKGDKDRLQTIQDSCRQALKVLQGN